MRLAAPGALARADARPFWVYVEGPRDRDVLCAWARRWSAPLARALPACFVILGGRRPARAVEHLRRERSLRDEAGGLCVLDRDGEAAAAPAPEPGLEFFTWSRRHIESYLLVPAAIERGMRLSPHDGRVDRYFRENLPPLEDEPAWSDVEAKRIFARHGDLARLLGRDVPPGKIARAMRAEELHEDVRTLFARLRDALGIREPETTRRNGR